MSTKCVVHLHLHLHVARKQLPDDLQERVRNYYDYSYSIIIIVTILITTNIP